mmetsp:Transcript_22645/g.31523  ORF Transcript_22645/g.31523 Transcript_22645/m.31523 type:complete len:97 (+) Transcript_22645:390-680(+)
MQIIQHHVSSICDEVDGLMYFYRMSDPTFFRSSLPSSTSQSYIPTSKQMGYFLTKRPSCHNSTNNKRSPKIFVLAKMRKIFANLRQREQRRNIAHE